MIENQNEHLADLQHAINLVQEKLLEAVETVKNEQVSNYPVIVAYSENEFYEIGIPIVLSQGPYIYNISTLEELFVKNIVNQEKVDNFRAVYNHKTEHLCVLLIIEQKADVIFVPYAD